MARGPVSIEVLQGGESIDAPKVLIARRRTIDLNDYKKPVQAAVKVPDSVKGKTLMGWRNGTVQDVSRLLMGNWLVVDEEEDRVVIAYLVAPIDTDELVDELRRVKWTVSDRNDGTPSRARTAGWLERHHARPGREGCSLSRLHRDHPAAGNAVVHYAPIVEQWYGSLNPDLYARHRELTEKVLPDYRLGDSLFTSAIVNRDNVLPYHHDAGNFKGVWSMMLGMKHDVGEDHDGNAGYLSIPEYDLALGVEDKSISAFDGQVALHGVTPFRKLSAESYRFTIVYYSKVGMWQCLPPDAELKEARKRRHEKEVRRWERENEPPHYRLEDGAVPESKGTMSVVSGGHWRCPDCGNYCYCPPTARGLKHEPCGRAA